MAPMTVHTVPRTPGRLGWTVLLFLFFLMPGVGHPTTVAHAEENSILTVAKDALYGAGTGLLLSAVTSLVVSKDSRGDVLRWGVVIGTFGGFARSGQGRRFKPFRLSPCSEVSKAPFSSKTSTFKSPKMCRFFW